MFLYVVKWNPPVKFFGIITFKLIVASPIARLKRKKGTKSRFNFVLVKVFSSFKVKSYFIILNKYFS